MPIFFHARRALQRFILNGDLFFTSLNMVFKGMRKAGAPLIQPIPSIPLIEIRIQRGARISVLRRLCRRQMHLREGKYVRRRTRIVQRHHTGRERGHLPQIAIQRVCGRLNVDFADQRRSVHADSGSRLTGGLRRKTGDARADGLFQLAALLRKPQCDFLRRRRFGVQLSLCGRIGIGQTRQNLTYPRNILPDVPHRIDNAPIRCAQNDVGMSAHDLHNHRPRHGILQLAQVADVDFQDTVARNAAHRQHTTAAEIFPKQHAEHRRLHRSCFRVLAQVHARRAGRRAEHKAMVDPLRTNQQMNFVFLRLNHAIHAAIPKHRI